MSTINEIAKIPHVPDEAGALISALRLGVPDLEPLSQLSEDQWASLIAFCDVAHLTLPLSRLPGNYFPEWVRERLDTNLADNAKRFENTKRSYSEIDAALRKSGVEYVVIKGFTQAPDYVTSPKLRAQSDFDIVCPPGQVEAAHSALETIGYRPYQLKKDKRADHTPTLIRHRGEKWKGNHFDPEIPLGIDLHFCLWNEQAMLFSIPVDDFWKRRVLRTVDGLSFPALHPVDHFGYLALHILRNILRGDWAIHLVRELATFLHTRAHDDSFWSQWVEMHDPRLRSFEAIAFYYAQAWFGCSMHPQVQEAISSLTPVQLHLLSRTTVTGLENMFRRNKDSIWLHMTLLSSVRNKAVMLARTLVPTSVSSINSPAVLTRNNRSIQPRSSSRWIQYVSYLFARSSSHLQSDITTLGRGLFWWLSKNQLPSQYWIFLTASFFFDLGFFIYHFLFNLFLIGRGYTEKNLGVFTSAMAIGSLVGAIPSGMLARRLGLRPVLLACFVLGIAVSSARALLLSFSEQVILAFLAGFILSAWGVCVSPAVAQLTHEKQRPTAFSFLFSLGIGLGAIGGLAGSRLPGVLAHFNRNDHGLDSTQIVLLLSCGIVALGIWPATKLRLTNAAISEKSRPLLTPFLLRYLPAIAVWSVVTGSFSPLASVYLARHVHLSLHQIGNAFAFSQISQVGAVLLAPALLRKLGLINGIVFTQIAAATLLLIMAFVTDPFAAAAAYVFFSAFQWMNEPGLYSLLMNMVSPEDRSGAAASNSLAMAGSQAIAGTLAGGAFTRYGYPPVLRGIALMALLAATLFRNLQPRPHPESRRVLDDSSGKAQS